MWLTENLVYNQLDKTATTEDCENCFHFVFTVSQSYLTKLRISKMKRSLRCPHRFYTSITQQGTL